MLPLNEVVPLMMAPMIMIQAPICMPIFLPQVSTAGPTKNKAQTPPIWYIAELRAAHGPSLVPLKKSRNCWFAVKPPNTEPSNPFWSDCQLYGLEERGIDDKSRVILITYHGLSEATQQKAAEESPRSRVPELRSFFDESLIVSLRALDDFDLCNIGLKAILANRAMWQLIPLPRTDSATFSIEDLAPLVSSTGDILRQCLLFNECEKTVKMELLVGRRTID